MTINQFYVISLIIPRFTTTTRLLLRLINIDKGFLKDQTIFMSTII